MHVVAISVLWVQPHAIEQHQTLIRRDGIVVIDDSCCMSANLDILRACRFDEEP